MRSSYHRLNDWTDRINKGTDTIQTSGNLWLTGESKLVQDYSLHSYQITPFSGVAGDFFTGSFQVQVSNDNVNWTKIAEYDWTTKTGAQLAYSDIWTFAYSRPVITGTDASSYLINERHLE